MKKKMSANILKTIYLLAFRVKCLSKIIYFSTLNTMCFKRNLLINVVIDLVNMLMTSY